MTTVLVGSQVSGVIRSLNCGFQFAGEEGRSDRAHRPDVSAGGGGRRQRGARESAGQHDQAQRDLVRTKDLFDKSLAAQTDYDNAVTAVDHGEGGHGPDVRSSTGPRSILPTR